MKKNCAYGLRLLLIVFAYRHIKGKEVSYMNKEQKTSIIRMRSDGMTFSEIANHLQLSINTVKSFYRRNVKTKPQLETYMHCGKPIDLNIAHQAERSIFLVYSIGLMIFNPLF